MSRQYNKVFDCMTCHKPIKLACKPDDSAWLKLELDGVTPHSHPSTKRQQQAPTMMVGAASNDENNPEVKVLLMQILRCLDVIQASLKTHESYFLQCRRHCHCYAGRIKKLKYLIQC